VVIDESMVPLASSAMTGTISTMMSVGTIVSTPYAVTGFAKAMNNVMMVRMETIGMIVLTPVTCPAVAMVFSGAQMLLPAMMGTRSATMAMRLTMMDA